MKYTVVPNRVQFVGLQVGQRFKTPDGTTFIKTSMAERVGKDPNKFPINCTNLDNGHRCSIANGMLVELLPDKE